VDVNQAIEVRVARIGINECKEDGKPCRTVFKRIYYDAASNTSLVLCSPLTGRTHQIRVHLNWLGHPITNDPLYGLAASPDSNSSKDSQLNNPSTQQQASTTSFTHSNATNSHNTSALATKSENSTSENTQSSVSNQTALTESSVNENNEVSSVSKERVSNEVSALMESVDYDADCPDCKKYLLNAEEQQMSLYLHALTYQSPEWTFETALPSWALPYVPVPELLHNAKQSIDTHITKMNDK
jgi:hypothetical protein